MKNLPVSVLGRDIWPLRNTLIYFFGPLFFPNVRLKNIKLPTVSRSNIQTSDQVHKSPKS